MFRNQLLMAAAVSGLLCLAACTKKVVADKPAPPAPTPVAANTPAPAPAPTPLATPARPVETPRAETPRPTTMTKEERLSLNEHLAHLVDALFDYDRYTIRADASTVLKEDVDVIRGILSNYPSQKLVIEGHADERGSAEYNVALGDKRAHAVNEFLTMVGIPATQLTVISYGKERPVCTDQTEECYQKNRRAHITAAQ